MKRCPTCTLSKDAAEFGRNAARADGLSSECRPCRRDREKSRRTASPDRYAARNRTYRAKNREKVNAAARALTMRLRDEVIVGLGGACECCDEEERAFLAIHHVNGRTPEDDVTGNALARLVKQSGFDRTKYRLLCHNCNCARGFYGVCPHEMSRLEVGSPSRSTAI